jgi:hypothetical protein
MSNKLTIRKTVFSDSEGETYGIRMFGDDDMFYMDTLSKDEFDSLTDANDVWEIARNYFTQYIGDYVECKNPYYTVFEIDGKEFTEYGR